MLPLGRKPRKMKSASHPSPKMEKRLCNVGRGVLLDPSTWALQILLGKYAASFVELINLPEEREKEANGGTDRRMRDSTTGSTFFAYCQGLSTRHSETGLIGDISTNVAYLKATCHGYPI
ncbi:hypothetical protein DMN91_012460 [Ooceraea biroi]|uniref:Uncharacterized protein n=1 Tax=Ooceraea biroi TaxID=2015173 RepID=A0A3L8D5F9_OOCBI|nr:hypothetical protein DMN91_012460 [Ooceraea biroi]